jgi:hypothetical protein
LLRQDGAVVCDELLRGRSVGSEGGPLHELREAERVDETHAAGLGFATAATELLGGLDVGQLAVMAAMHRAGRCTAPA